MIEGPKGEDFAIPYIDMVLQPELPAEFHLHYGYWHEPHRNVTETDEYRVAQQRLVDVLFDHLGESPARSEGPFVDVGCGIGGAIARLDARCEGARLVGLNIDARQLRVAQARVHSERNRIDWVHADACAPYPFEPGSIAGMISIECLPHVSSRREALVHIKDALRVGGRFAVADIESRARLLARSDAERAALAEVVERGFGPWPALLVDESLAALGESLGFSVIENRDITANVLPSRLLMKFGGDSDVIRAIHAATEELHRMFDAGEMEYRLVVLEKC